MERRSDEATKGRHGGFSLIEVLLAVFILGIGAIGIAALFPAGIAQQRSSVDDVIGPIVADNALALLRLRVSPEDFGTFEDFGLSPAGPLDAEMRALPWPTAPGDWPWLRPGFILGDDSSTRTFGGDAYDERGALDIFSYRYTRQNVGLPESGSLPKATEFPQGVPLAAPQLYGIPYNRAKYFFSFAGGIEPRKIVTQRERYYPMVTGEVPAGATPTVQPQYAWDCMFRRFQGRIYVAVFVYRVNLPGGGQTTYVTPPNPLVTGGPGDPLRPPLPCRLDLTDAGSTPAAAWDAYGNDPATTADDALVLGTPSGTTYNPGDPVQAWQEHRQWLLDQNNNVLRVLSAAREGDGDPDTEDLVVELLRPPAPLPRSNLFYSRPTGPSGLGVENIVTHLWYVPVEVELDLDGDGTVDAGSTAALTPVYVAVREL